MSYDKLSKKELLLICEKLKLKSYKTKNKPELIKMIESKNKPTNKEINNYIIEELVENEINSDSESDSDSEIENKLNKLKDQPIIKPIVEINDQTDEKNNEKDEPKEIKNNDIDIIIGGIQNIVLESYEEKLKRLYEKRMDELYKMLHKANMRALNYQFKYRAEYAVARYNNLESLKKRINIYNV